MQSLELRRSVWPWSTECMQVNSLAQDAWCLANRGVWHCEEDQRKTHPEDCEKYIQRVVGPLQMCARYEMVWKRQVWLCKQCSNRIAQRFADRHWEDFQFRQQKGGTTVFLDKCGWSLYLFLNPSTLNGTFWCHNALVCKCKILQLCVLIASLYLTRFHAATNEG